MTTVAIRKKLVDYLKVADDKKVKAMYALLEDDIEQDAASAYYKKGGKMVSAVAADKEIKKLLQSAKRK